MLGSLRAQRLLRFDWALEFATTDRACAASCQPTQDSVVGHFHHRVKGDQDSHSASQCSEAGSAYIAAQSILRHACRADFIWKPLNLVIPGRSLQYSYTFHTVFFVRLTFFYNKRTNVRVCETP